MKYGKSQLLNLLETVPRRGWTWQKIKDLVDSLWRDPVAGAAAESGLGMDFTTGNPVDMGTPSTIDSTTENAVTETSHTHALGDVAFDNIKTNAGNEYGCLYNWPVTQENVAPTGWHVPTKTEWETLLNGIDTYDSGAGTWPSAGGKLKLNGLFYWNEPNTGATNELLFSAVAGGTRDTAFNNIKNTGYYLTETEYGVPGWEDYIYIFQLSFALASIQADNIDLKNHGFSLRFIKDDSTDPGTVTDFDENVYTTVKIGSQVWMAENFRGTHLNDGTPIEGPEFTNEEWAALTTPAYCIYKQPLSDVITSLENQPDEKIKYDAADPTAGYLSEKIIAGTNITITEGIGADENKLKISVTGDIATTYLGLTDTSDSTYTGKDLNVPMVNEATDELDLTETEIATFLVLSDTPSAYTGAANKLVSVKADQSGLEFTTQVTLPVKASAAELNTGTDDAKFATAKALKDGEFIGIHVGTSPPSDTTLLWLDTN